MSAEGTKVTVVAHGLIEALKKDGVNLDDRLGRNASNYVRSVVSDLSRSDEPAEMVKPHYMSDVCEAWLSDYERGHRDGWNDARLNANHRHNSTIARNALKEGV
jgi:hypothetical protein